MASNCIPIKANRKGMSPLQERILKLAKNQGGEVLARDVLIKEYNFRPIRYPNSVGQGKMVFNKSGIGFSRYNSATVSVCKAFNRLIARGFAWKIHGGIRLKWSRYRNDGRMANFYRSQRAHARARI